MIMKDINKINDFINIVLTQVCRSFSQNCDFKHELGDVYPYIKYAQLNSNKQEICDNSYDSLGELYETFLPINIRKDYGQFYTRDHDVINTMLDNLNLLSGKILEPSCGSGIFIISILKKMVISLKQKELNEEQIINYICENVYANDIDPNAIKIAELNVLWFLMPLIVKAKIDNPKFIMKKLHFTNYDFTQKNIFSEKFSVIVGNPPFVTMYGKRSRNMTEEKRVYYNTFDFVQHKNGNNKFNISMFFVENALKILKNKGVLSFILDITFYETAFKDLRKYIVENY